MVDLVEEIPGYFVAFTPLLDDGAEETTYYRVDKAGIDDVAALRVDADLAGAVDDVLFDDEISVGLIIEDLVFGVLDDGVEVQIGMYFFILDLKIGIILVVLIDEGGDFGGELFGEVGELDGARVGLFGKAGDFGNDIVEEDQSADEDGGYQQGEDERF